MRRIGRPPRGAKVEWTLALNGRWVRGDNGKPALAFVGTENDGYPMAWSDFDHKDRQFGSERDPATKAMRRCASIHGCANGRQFRVSRCT